MFDSGTIGVAFGLGVSKNFKMEKMKTGSCIDILNNWVYHGWEGHICVIMINVYLPVIALVNSFPIRAKRGKVYAFRCVQFI